MITQRELDIAQIEAKLRAEELYNEWHSDFLANRGKREDNAEGPVRGLQTSEAEGGFPAESGNYNPET